MPKDWQDITDEELLNFSGPQTAEIARYERIMQKRSTEAVLSLRDKLTGLMETIYRASQGIQEKSNEVLATYERASVAQQRQQRALFVLSLVVAASTVVYTWITWQSVAAMREANEIQRELLTMQKAASASAAAPNPSIERTSPGKPVAASHVKR